MLGMFILGVGVLVGVMLVLRWYVGAEPKALVKALKWTALVLAVGVLAVLALTGKLWAAAAALPAVVVWFVRLYTGLRYAQMFRRFFGTSGAGWSRPGASGASSNAGSDVRTRFVVMHLDHATGAVRGEVLDGRFRVRPLDDLSLDEVLELLNEAQAASDPDSVRLVESYLDRRSPGWRTRERHQAPPSSSSAMSRAEALRLLGLKDGATPADIKAAHRRLMAQVHPDHGGTDYLAQQINQAKDVLLD